MEKRTENRGEKRSRVKRGLRGVVERHPKNNRFRRLCGLCGISGREAASYLDIAKQTVNQKMLGLRGITEEEEVALLALWRLIRDRHSALLDDPSLPSGALYRQRALREATLLLAGEEVRDEDVRIEEPAPNPDEC